MLFKRQPAVLHIEAYGVAFTLEASDRRLLAELRGLLPPVWTDRESTTEALRLRVSRDGSGRYDLVREGRSIATGERELVLDSFERQVRLYAAFHAPEHVFVHAGAVVYRGFGIAIPGPSFSGKTTLTGAFVRAGAAYCSDECAVFDADGLLHGYSKPLAVRLSEQSASQTNHTPDDLGGSSANDPVPLAVVILSRYRPGAKWRPVELSPATATLSLFEHAFQGPGSAERALQRLGLATPRVIGLRGERGDAAEVVSDILSRLDELSQP